MADRDSAQGNAEEFKRLSVEEIQELAGEQLPERMALSLFNAGIGTLPFGHPVDQLVEEPQNPGTLEIYNPPD